ncbi:MAG: 3-phosphoshikimate 1-carboxyvinyltransferase [Ignavibacteriae bacterium]|nr:3-phosphoshikimate 1-carboxyvinyltransferase [Ignavibacteriota bacterium]
MVKEITPISHPVRLAVCVPGSKSITNRALICASLAKGESVIRNASDSTDTAMMANGLNQLGVLVRKRDDALIVDGTGGKLYAPKFPIPVGNAGTTLRFMLSLAALATGKTVFDGSDRMAERPIAELLDALNQCGVRASAGGVLPRYVVEGGSLRGGAVQVKAERSSQFLSSLLMVAPYALSDSEITLDGEVASAPYVDLTLAVMRAFGVEVKNADRRFQVEAKRNYHPAEFFVEPDASGASYFLGAAAILGGEVLVREMRLNSLQGDAKFASVLQRMGCVVQETNDGVMLRRDGALRGIDADMNSMPDVVPTLAVVALFAESPTRIRNVAHLRHKESDRLEALHTELSKLGAQVVLVDDGLEIVPAPLHAAQLDTNDDHRLAMSFALAGLKAPGVRIENPDCVRKSFPKFWSEWEKLYASQST